MQVRHAFPSLGSVVDDNPVALVEMERSGQTAGGEQQVSEEHLAIRCHLGNPRERGLWNDEEVHGCLWGDVVDGDAVCVFVRNSCRNLAVDDLLKKGLCHEKVLAPSRLVSRRNLSSEARAGRASRSAQRKRRFRVAVLGVRAAASERMKRTASW